MENKNSSVFEEVKDALRRCHDKKNYSECVPYNINKLSITFFIATTKRKLNLMLKSNRFTVHLYVQHVDMY